MHRPAAKQENGAESDMIKYEINKLSSPLRYEMHFVMPIKGSVRVPSKSNNRFIAFWSDREVSCGPDEWIACTAVNKNP